jgi:hypothetical protein
MWWGSYVHVHAHVRTYTLVHTFSHRQNLPAHSSISFAHRSGAEQLVRHRQEDRFNELAFPSAGHARTAQLEQIVALGPFTCNKRKKG